MEATAATARGTYALILDTPTCRIAVGRMGRVSFLAGLYAYVGSALGSGGLAARVARHHRTSKRRHWHIDYLLERAHIVAVYTDASGCRLECAWSEALKNCSGVSPGPAGFGASDCRCETHLYYLGSNAEADLRLVARALGVAP